MAILIIDFKSYSDADFLAKSKLIKASLSDHPIFTGEVPPYVTSVLQLGESIDWLQAACDAAATRDSVKIKLKNVARKVVEKNLKNIAQHLELVAAGDPEKLHGTGFDLRKQAIRVKNVKALPVPHFAVRHGDESCVMVVKANKVPGARSYLLFITDGDPTVEENWRQYDVYTSVAPMIITGLQPGKTYSFRMCAVGPQGRSAWSMIYTLMAI